MFLRLLTVAGKTRADNSAYLRICFLDPITRLARP